jgi:hypothetical protein
MEKKFRWKPDFDLGRRNLITKKIKSILKEEPILPENLFRGYYTDFEFKTPSGGSYRFYYAGGDTAKGGIYYLISTK